MGGGDLRGHRARRSDRGRDLADRRGRQSTAGAAARQLPLVHAVRRDADAVADRDTEWHRDHVVDHVQPHAVADRVQPRAGELSDAAAATFVDTRADDVCDDDDHRIEHLEHHVDHVLEHVDHDIDLVVEDDRKPDARSLTDPHVIL